MSKTEIGRSGTQTEHMKRVKAAGGVSFKIAFVGRRGAPDCIDLYPVPEEHREIVARYFRFTECKAPGKKPRVNQARMHKRLRDMGYRVDVYDGGDDE